MYDVNTALITTSGEQRREWRSLEVRFYVLVKYLLVAMPFGVRYTGHSMHMHLAAISQGFQTKGVLDIIL